MSYFALYSRLSVSSSSCACPFLTSVTVQPPVRVEQQGEIRQRDLLVDRYRAHHMSVPKPPPVKRLPKTPFTFRAMSTNPSISRQLTS